ncbi:MAG TPA: hypothetical protein VGO49_18630 [Bradyrhizobium sp.]|nr:hypothetical protein [Bradyrhizobium sp.]
MQNTLKFIEETAPTFYSVETYFHDPKVPVQSHDTMTWREASDHVDYLHRNIKSSVLLPLYGIANAFAATMSAVAARSVAAL